MEKQTRKIPIRQKLALTAAKQERANINKQGDSILVLSDRQAHECDRFQSCGAPICPLDPDWQKRSYFDGERVCFYLSEWSKTTTRPILARAIGVKFALALAEVYPKVMDAYGPLRKRLKRASRTPSRLKFSGVDHG